MKSNEQKLVALSQEHQKAKQLESPPTSLPTEVNNVSICAYVISIKVHISYGLCMTLYVGVYLYHQLCLCDHVEN